MLMSPRFFPFNNLIFKKIFLEVGFEDLSISLLAQECFVGRKSRESFAAPRQHDKIHGVTRRVRVGTKLGL